jgi:subtilisin family serine protease
MLRIGVLPAFVVLAALLLATATPPSAADEGVRHEQGWSSRDDDHDDDHEGDEEEEEEEEEENEDEDEDETSATVRLPTFGPAARGTPTIRYVPGELLVRFRAGTTPAEMQAAASRAEGTLVGPVSGLGLHIVEVPPSRVQTALLSLGSEPSVETVERDLFLEGLDTIPNDALWSTQWGWRLVGAPLAWDASRGEPGVVIAVIDTGVDSQHADLRGAMVPGYDFVNDDADPSDDEGHGTAVAGVIAARTNNDEGQSGVCWTCSLMPVKVLDSGGSGKTSTVALGIVWAVDHGARVLNLSLGGPGTTSALQAAVQYAASRDAVLVASAGNSGVDTPFYPAGYPQAISVAATTPADARYSWSNFGSWVQVAAPGCNTAPRLRGGYVEFCGTSSAAPMVAGIAGLAVALNPRASRTDLGLAIARSATPLPGVVQFGRVNAPTVMSAVSSGGSANPVQTAPPPPAPPPPPVEAPPPLPPPPPAAAPATPSSPRNVSRPRLRGLARIGLRLRVVVGTWSPSPVVFAFVWQRCAPNGTRCKAIARANGLTYRLNRIDRGRRLRALVVARNAAGAGQAFTAASSIVRARPFRR